MTNTARKAGRSLSLDAHRGFIMILMAIDHACEFIARYHSQEFWGVSLPVHSNTLLFFTRWITHICAPGFFFLMGIGMMLLADARRGAGFSENRITRFFIVRGILLMIFQLVIENPAWDIGDGLAHTGVFIIRGGIPGSDAPISIYLGVLFCLGASMIIWAFMRRLSPWLIGAVSIIAILLTQYIIPGPDQAQTVFSPIITALFIPGQSNSFQVLFPVVPWLGVTGLGLLYGKWIQQFPDRTRRWTFWAGIILLLLFAAIRAIGGFGNLNIVPKGWMGFLNVVKYPPSLAFLTLTLGINLIIISLWNLMQRQLQGSYNPLIIFGRTALFFYLVHLWLYALLGFFFRDGSSLLTMYSVWLFGLVVLYGLCYKYDRFKRLKPQESIWRFL